MRLPRVGVREQVDAAEERAALERGEVVQRWVGVQAWAMRLLGKLKELVPPGEHPHALVISDDGDVVKVDALPMLTTLRRLGWSVAVHNDYRMNNETFTFWLFTRGNRCAKGEGKTDEEALKNVMHEVTCDAGVVDKP